MVITRKLFSLFLFRNSFRHANIHHLCVEEKKLLNLLGIFKIVVSLHTELLGYGVMVTLQILVLTFQVRILVAQLRLKEALFCSFKTMPFSLLLLLVLKNHTKRS